jgi:hypothetical protein
MMGILILSFRSFQKKTLETQRDLIRDYFALKLLIAANVLEEGAVYVFALQAQDGNGVSQGQLGIPVNAGPVVDDPVR